MPKAIASYEQALAIAREIGDLRAEGAQTGNLGNACRALGEVDKAIEHTRAALEIDEDIKDPRAEQAHRQLVELEKESSQGPNAAQGQ